MHIVRPAILIVDDDPLLLALLEHHLGAAGFAVSTADSGAAALDAIRMQRPDVVILDAMMPVMGGVEVLHRLRADPQLCGIKVIMLTTLHGEQHVLKAFELGASDFVAKPFSADELVSRIARLVNARAA